MEAIRNSRRVKKIFLSLSKLTVTAGYVCFVEISSYTSICLYILDLVLDVGALEPGRQTGFYILASLDSLVLHLLSQTWAAVSFWYCLVGLCLDLEFPKLSLRAF